MLDDKKKPVLGSKAQEMLMQDILESTQELVNMLGYHSTPCEFEIIAIERPETDVTSSEPSNILCYQTEKQRRVIKRRA
jgi:hypothetical protein